MTTEGTPTPKQHRHHVRFKSVAGWILIVLLALGIAGGGVVVFVRTLFNPSPSCRIAIY